MGNKWSFYTKKESIKLAEPPVCILDDSAIHLIGLSTFPEFININKLNFEVRINNNTL